MKVTDAQLPKDLADILLKEFSEFRPSQEKAIDSGLLEGKNLLVCTPTASGKTIIGEIAMVKSIIEGKGKGVYVVPLKSLATEKYKNFSSKYKGLIKVGLAIGDVDTVDTYLNDCDIIICTPEKLDSLFRHSVPWIKYIATLVVDEIHLLNDIGRGPTLEIIITLLRSVVPKIQVIGLSATIGNPEELAKWLDANLVVDTWRPVKLKQGIAHDTIQFLK